MLSEDDVKELKLHFSGLQGRYEGLLLSIATLSNRLASEEAQEYLLQGAARRLRILIRCVQNIYRIYPPERVGLLTDEELLEACINLHAFYVDIFGMLDNLAWVLNYEKNFSLDKRAVGLYTRRMRPLLSDGLREFLHSEEMLNWHDTHLKDYRDALAHRIPLYVPPYVTVTNGSGNSEVKPAPWFVHSAREVEGPMIMHAQLLADFTTIEHIIQAFLEFEFPD